jgi:hypothetical protein
MPRAQSRPAFWWVLLAAIIAIGILSRVTQTGVRIVDKYLGDALYAAMIYVLFRLTNRIRPVALWAAIAMIAIEAFQLTGVAAGMLRTGGPITRMAARLLGTEFSVLDLAAYTVGIGCLASIDHWRATSSQTRAPQANPSSAPATSRREPPAS